MQIEYNGKLDDVEIQLIQQGRKNTAHSVIHQ